MKKPKTVQNPSSFGLLLSKKIFLLISTGKSNTIHKMMVLGRLLAY